MRRPRITIPRRRRITSGRANLPVERRFDVSTPTQVTWFVRPGTHRTATPRDLSSA